MVVQGLKKNLWQSGGHTAASSFSQEGCGVDWIVETKRVKSLPECLWFLIFDLQSCVCG